MNTKEEDRRVVTTADVIRCLRIIKSKAKEIEAKFPKEYRACKISMYQVANITTQAIDLIWCYVKEWDHRAKPKALRDEDIHKIITIGKWLFTEIFSYVEFCIKNCLRSVVTGPLSDEFNTVSWIKIRDVTKESHKQGGISATEKDSWFGLNKLRNCIVHNATIGDETRDYVFGDITLMMKEDGPIKFNIDMLPMLTSHFLDLFDRWRQWFLETHELQH